jgi:hypothetical protein
MWIFLAFCICATAAAGQATGFKTESVPMAINIEGKPVRSSIYLQYDTKPYGMTLEQFAIQKLDDREKFFSQGLRAIRNRDYANLSVIWQAPPANSKASVAMNVSTAKSYLDTFAVGYGKFEGLKILHRVEMNSGSLFLWGAKATNGVFWPEGSIVIPSAKKLAFQPVTPSDTVANLIVDSAVAASIKPADFTPVADVHSKYRAVLGSTGRTTPSPHPIALQFDGVPLNFSVFDAAEPPANPVLAFYQDAYMKLKRRAFDDFVKTYAPESQRSAAKFAANLKLANASEYFDSLTSSRYVKFLLNADPVFLVFYSNDKSDKWSFNSLHHDYVVRDLQTGTYKLANFAFTSSFDDLLNDQDLFDQQIFRRGAVPAVTQPNSSQKPNDQLHEDQGGHKK